MDELRAWMCKKGHVLGVISKNGRRLKKLLVYREAVDPKHMEDQDPPEVMMVGDGPLYNIVCSKCGETRNWTPGMAEMKAITDRFFRRQEPIDIDNGMEDAEERL
jgi:hypothetical protein